MQLMHQYQRVSSGMYKPRLNAKLALIKRVTKFLTPRTLTRQGCMSETQKIDESGTDLAAQINPFILKTCVVAAVVTACTIFTADWIIGSAEESFQRSLTRVRESVRSVQPTSIGGHKFWARLEEELDRAASPASDLPPERKQKLIDNVRTITARWRPVIEALQDDRQSPTEQKSK
jgi:hypothetical protein